MSQEISTNYCLAENLANLGHFFKDLHGREFQDEFGEVISVFFK
jgi:hypothetical protein